MRARRVAAASVDRSRGRPGSGRTPAARALASSAADGVLDADVLRVGQPSRERLGLLGKIDYDHAL